MANTDLNALSTEFPDNRIVLVNGTELVCYPKVVQPECYSEDRLSIDTTGTYLTVGSKPFVKKEMTEQDERKDFFYKNAFLFYRNAHRILNDSRMFLAPVPIQSGLMYVGTSGLQSPTLGVYIEWWLNCEADLTKDEQGNDALTCRFAGSPLSGTNHCICVYPDGKTGDISHSRFIKVWRPLMTINARYTKAKQMYEAYSLQKVVELLLAAGETRESELETQLDIAMGRERVLKHNYSCLMQRYDDLHAKYDDLIILHYKEELDDYRSKYLAMREKAEQEMEVLSKERDAFRLQMKQGKITNVEFQHAITPLTRRRKALENELSAFRLDRESALINKGHITHALIDKYMNQ